MQSPCPQQARASASCPSRRRCCLTSWCALTSMPMMHMDRVGSLGAEMAPPDVCHAQSETDAERAKTKLQSIGITATGETRNGSSPTATQPGTLQHAGALLASAHRTSLATHWLVYLPMLACTSATPSAARPCARTPCPAHACVLGSHMQTQMAPAAHPSPCP